MPDKKMQLDKIDLRILDILRNDGRISYRQLSERVNLTPRPCQARVERLEALGIIAGYRAVIHAPSDKKSIVVLAQIVLADHGRSQTPFEAEMRANPAVLDCWLVSGTFDFLVRLACEDLDEYRRIANAWLESPRFRIEKIVTTAELQVIKRSGV
ncbi:AsnC family transcriptional regulator [Burkholderia ubonensis]|uniref:Lrp/AsnC family transcriptional regulator n=1 Tax=Burkholderia ubonensis TaxID=101571 RepID=UPI00075E981F|nr:Lrp/AsnC family transcriptional regulator [Burkholderia ubonensis]KVZ02132.1 AsnC family transcriptional regulator [Burkholderia ubonensis]KWE58855.1 AsnC family transcriptional regulator [Burkholderia ubonensis]KWE92606.1 AsnC family transcriptional regulator [Burkholderia ubonensis]